MSTDAIADRLGVIHDRGVRLWADNERLCYRAGRGVLSGTDVEHLRVSKSHIMARFERTAGAAVHGAQRTVRFDQAPLAFSQLMHWNLYQLHERPAIRQIVSAQRLKGRLNVAALRKSIAEVAKRHDALRTRVVVCGNTPVQMIDRELTIALPVEDLSHLMHEEREARVRLAIEKLILEPIDVADGPLVGATLLKLQEAEHVFVLAMEHMVSDGISIGLLVAELLNVYGRLVQGRPLPPESSIVQFADFAVWQRSSLSGWLERHRAYWNERLGGDPRTRFPRDEARMPAGEGGWGTIPLHIRCELKQELQEWCRLRHTTMTMTVFAAYVALVLRWCDVPVAVVQYETNGRVSQKLEQTIGYLAHPLYSRVRLRPEDTFLDLLATVTEEYCSAYEHADGSYMESMWPRPQFACNSAFNWVPRGPEINLSELHGSAEALECEPVSFEHPMLRSLTRDNEPVILLYETESDIVGDVSFPRWLFAQNSMARLAESFLILIKAFIRDSDRRVLDVTLPR